MADEIGSTVETDPQEISAMAASGLVIRESEVEILAHAYRSALTALKDIRDDFDKTEERREQNGESRNYVAERLAGYAIQELAGPSFRDRR